MNAICCLAGQKLDHRPAGVTSAAMMTHDLKSILGLTTKSPLLETEMPLEAHDKSCTVAPNESIAAAGARTEKRTGQIEAPTPIPAQNAVSKIAAQTHRRPTSVTQHPVKGTDTSQKQLQRRITRATVAVREARVILVCVFRRQFCTTCAVGGEKRKGDIAFCWWFNNVHAL